MQDHQLHEQFAPECFLAPGAGESRGTVLIVEDEYDIAELLAYNLNKGGYGTVMAEDGIRACQLVESECPDLILLDIMLPGKNGWQVCEYIRTHPDETIATSPVVMLTALGEQKDKLKGIELGADVYLAKPYSVKEVLLHCDRLVTARKQTTALRRELVRIRAHEQGNIDLQSMLFHELRSQLVIIGGFCNRLQHHIAEGETEKNLLSLDTIGKSVRHLSAVSDEILLIRKIEAGKVDLSTEVFDFSQVVLAVIDLYRQKLRGKGITFQESVIGPGTIRANMVALRLIVSNLLENAVKYCGRGDEVGLQARVDEWTGEVVIEVWDDGPGIAVAEQKDIFERYYRGRDVRNSVHGSGIGLFAVRKLAEAMGGSATVSSSEGNGCCFLVRFTIQPYL